MARFQTGLRLALGCMLSCLFCLAAAGQPPGTFNYRGGGQGTVSFDHGLHASKGYVCGDCHTRSPTTGTQLFQTQKQGLISVADHSSDRKCFACHNGKVAFNTCDQCHR
jgi:thiosulfate reductase cytochrome b subunit